MKKKLTENIGLKILSLLAAFILWLVVVNVDDPVINRTYSGITVEILNDDLITQDGKCYEVVGGSDVISVVVSAKRSVLDDLSRDYIKATADVKQLTSGDYIPIEVRTTKFYDAIEEISSRTDNLQLHLEDIVEKKIPLEMETVGEVEDGYLLSTVTPKFEEITISGPESEVMKVQKAVGVVDVDGLSADESIMVPIELASDKGPASDIEEVTMDHDSVSVNVVIWGTKEVPVTCSASGTPADGYSVSSSPTVDPESVIITGRSAYLDSMSSIEIPAEDVSVSGMAETLVKTVDISKYLPNGITFADDDFDGNVTVTVEIEVNDIKSIDVPTANISIVNVPEGYKATLVDVGGSIPVEIQGKGETYDSFDGSQAVGVIDALSLMPRNATEKTDVITLGANDGRVIFSFPSGVTEASPVYMQVIIEQEAAG